MQQNRLFQIALLLNTYFTVYYSGIQPFLAAGHFKPFKLSAEGYNTKKTGQQIALQGAQELQC